MPAITRLCERAILVEEGAVLKDGPSHQVVAGYLASGLGTTAAREWPDPAEAPGNEIACLRAVRVRTEDGRISDAMDIRRAIGIEMEFEVLQPGHVLVPSLSLTNEQSVCLFVSCEDDDPWRGRPRLPGRYTSTAWIPGNLLTEGTMFVGARLLGDDRHLLHVQEEQAVAFQVIDSLEGDSARGDYGGRMGGSIRPLLEWSTQYTPEECQAAVTGPGK